MDELSWLDQELPIHLEFEKEKVIRELDRLDRDDMEELIRRLLSHNVDLVNISKQERALCRFNPAFTFRKSRFLLQVHVAFKTFRNVPLTEIWHWD